MNFRTRRFDRAAGTYHGFSGVQEAMGQTLVDLYDDLASPSRESSPPGSILEMGCGTGHFTGLLRTRFPEADLTATDASPRMLAEARKALGGAGRLLPFDAEGNGADVPGPVRADAPYDLAASNALVQWFPDLAAHFRMVAGLLAPGGRYLVSGFLRDNFPELNGILAEPPFGYRDFPGHDYVEIEAAAGPAFSLEGIWKESMPRTYSDPRAFLAAIQGSGSARRPRQDGPMTRSRLDFLVRTYGERHGVEGGVRATWRPWCAVLRKPLPR